MARTSSPKLPRDEKRRAFADDAIRALRNFQRTGVAYTFADVERWYILAKAAGKNPRKPKPIKVPRSRR